MLLSSDDSVLDRHPRFRQMADYLAQQAPREGLAGRQHLDPTDLKSILPYINLVEVIGQGDDLDFRFRLFGSAQVQALNRDVTGQLVRDVFDPVQASRIAATMREAVIGRRPHFSTSHVPREDRRHIHYDRIHFPLAADGKTVDMLMSVHVYYQEKSGIAGIRP